MEGSQYLTTEQRRVASNSVCSLERLIVYELINPFFSLVSWYFLIN